MIYKYINTITLLGLIIIVSCTSIDKLKIIGDEIGIVFPNTESFVVTNEQDNLDVYVSDSEFNLIESYLENKADFIAYLATDLKFNKPINVKLAISDSVMYTQLYDVQELNLVKNKYEKNTKYEELTRIIFKNFDLNDYWNLENALRVLGEHEHNKDLDFGSVFQMTFALTDPSKSEGQKKKTYILFTEGFKLINSAGMTDFWDHDKRLNSSTIAADINKLFNYLNYNNVSTKDSIIFKDGMHIIDFDQ